MKSTYIVSLPRIAGSSRLEATIYGLSQAAIIEQLPIYLKKKKKKAEFGYFPLHEEINRK